MNSIPLIKGNTPQEINISIIALKKALSELEAQDRLLQGTDKDVQNKIKQINELIEGINTHLSTIDNQITALQPVDTVTSGNMHSVTSNAVFNAIGQWETVAVLGNNGTSFIKGLSTPNGKYLYIRLNGLSGGTYNNGDVLFTIPEGWRPIINEPTRCIVMIDTITDRITAGLDIHSYGSANVYFHGHTQFGQSVTVSGFFTDILLPIS